MDAAALSLLALAVGRHRRARLAAGAPPRPTRPTDPVLAGRIRVRCDPVAPNPDGSIDLPAHTDPRLGLWRPWRPCWIRVPRRTATEIHGVRAHAVVVDELTPVTPTTPDRRRPSLASAKK